MHHSTGNTRLPRAATGGLRSWMLGFLWLATAAGAASPAKAAPPAAVHPAPRPNVLFILADDLGWSDTTLYGTTRFYETPHLERLARRGMTFTRAYSASPLCSPTRASILTGLSPARHGITSPTCHLPQEILHPVAPTSGPPAAKAVPVTSATRLGADEATLPKILQRAGYATGHFGKWHLGPEPYSPLQHGFDVDVPHHPGPGPAGSYLAPWKFKDFDHDPEQPRQHIEDRMANEAVAWMEQHREQPFFLNYWMFSVHAPFEAKPEYIARHRRRADPADPQRSPTYAAMVQSMDDAVGRLLDAVDRLGLAERTVIVFASDNGGNMYDEVDGVPPTSNAPLRGGKATMFEGGIRGPCVIVWPGVAAGGARSDQVIQSCDFLPTLLEITGLREETPPLLDGVNIAPALRGEALSRSEIFTYFPHQPRVPDWLPPAVSVHQGDWKLIRLFHGGEAERHAYRLYHLAEDPGEQRDLSAAEPERVSRLDSLIDGFLKDTNAVTPQPNAAFDPRAYRPEEIGRPAPRRRGQPALQTVQGWTPSRDCVLAAEPGRLVVRSTGGDPFLVRVLPQPLPAGTYRLRIKMFVDARGEPRWYWRESGVQPQFARERSCDVRRATRAERVVEANAYEADFTAARPIVSFRLDPAQGRGEIRIRELSLEDAKGNSVFQWEAKP